MTQDNFNTTKTDTPVVALHSSASNGSQWKVLAAELQDRHDVHAFDLPGYSRDLSRDEAIAGMEAVALPIIDQIVKLDWPVHLIGHSFGGGVAIKIALMRPELVKSLTLFEPAAFHVLEHRDDDGSLLGSLKDIGTLLRTSTGNGRADLGMKGFVNFWNGDDAWERMSDNIRTVLAGIARTVIADFASVFSETWTLENLAGLTMPTLMLTGMDSPAIAQRTAALVRQHIPGCELAMLPGLGHMAPIEAPDWVNPRIRQHIARVERQPVQFSWPEKLAA